MFGCRHGFIKGFISGMLLGGAACTMVEPPDMATMRKMKRKAGRIVKRVEYAIEDMMGK